MGTWLERARAEISKATVVGAVNTPAQKSNGTIGSTPSPLFLEIWTESGLIFPKRLVRVLPLQPTEIPNMALGGGASMVSRRRQLSALNCARLRSPSLIA